MKTRPDVFKAKMSKPQPIPPLERARILMETEQRRHEERLETIKMQFEAVMGRIEQTQKANEDHFQARMRILQEAESAALKARKARPATFQDRSGQPWASRPAGVPPAKPRKKRR